MAARIDTDTCFEESSDEALLELPMCDLPLAIGKAPIAERIERLFSELSAKGIRFRPSFWLSDEWFSPDNVPGIAIPFYLAHPRLTSLERKMMGRAEGANEIECMKILRHEMGHAMDTAYRFRCRKEWREVFGLFSTPYPNWYKPDPWSREYVFHLDGWYAQSHPSEDFAETFAVWLTPRSSWRKQYEAWPALQKLNYVDRLMYEMRTKQPLNWRRGPVEPLRSLRKTLRQHYTERKKFYRVPWAPGFDNALRRMFPCRMHRGGKSAKSFLLQHRLEIATEVCASMNAPRYMVDQALAAMIQRSSELKLAVTTSDNTTTRAVNSLLETQVSRFVHLKHRRIAL